MSKFNNLDVPFIFINLIMAETKEKKPVKYKFGEHELDLQSYIEAIDNNVKDYMDKQGWNEGQKREFMAAYQQYFTGLKDQLANGTNRFSTNGFGTILDSQRQLSNKDNDDIDPVGSEWYYDKEGNRITTDDYNMLKKKKQGNYKTFSANRHVATYFDNIGRNLIKAGQKYKEPEKETNHFDLTKHGFVKYFGDTYNPTGGAWDGSAILNLDLFDENTGKRGNSQRQARFNSDIDNYIKWLPQDIDFSKTQFRTRDGYIKHLQTLKGKINDGLNEQDYLDFGTIGATKDFMQPFVHSGKFVTQTAEQLAADRKKREEDEAKAAADAKEKEKQQKRQEYIRAALNTFDQSMLENPSYKDGIYLHYTPNQWFTDDGFNREAFNTIHGGVDAAAKAGAKYIDDFYSGKRSWFPTDTDTDDDKVIRQYALRNIIFDPNYATKLPDNTTTKTLGLSGFYYIPRSTDRQTYRALIFNPETNVLKETFIGNTNLWEDMLRQFDIDNNYIDRTQLYMESGGVLKFQHGSAGEAWAKRYRAEMDADLESRAKERGRTKEEQKAGESSALEEGYWGTLGNDFASDEWLRLAGGIADAASALAGVIPGVGTGVSAGLGLTSTMGNLVADIKDESVNGLKVLGNFGANLGFDLIGLAPGGLGAAGKASKILRSLRNVAPTVLGVWSALHTIPHVDDYYRAWEKVLTPKAKLTKDDLNMLVESSKVLFSLFGGGGRYAKSRGLMNGRRSVDENLKRLNPGDVDTKKVAVEMIAPNGQRKTVMFEGNDAKDIRSIQQSGDLAKLRAATVDKYENLQGYKLQETGNWKTPREWKRAYSPLNMLGLKHRATTPADVTFDVVSRNGETFIRRPYRSDIKQSDMVASGKTWKEVDDTFIESQMKPLQEASAIHEKSYNKALRTKERTLKQLNDETTKAKSDLQEVKDTGSGKSSAELHEQIKGIRRAHQEGTYAQRKTQQTQTEVSLNNLEKSLADKYNKRQILEQLAMDQASGKQKGKVSETKSLMDRMDAEIRDLETQITAQKQLLGEHNKWLSDFDNSDARMKAMIDEKESLDKLEKQIKALEEKKTKWEKYSPKAKSKARVEFEKNHKPNAEGKITFKDGDREITRVLSDILTKYNIKYKQGGSISNVRKFQSGNIVRTINTADKYLTNRTNLESDARDVAKWDNWYNYDAIYEDFLKKSTDLDVNAWITSMNNMGNFQDLSWDKQLNAKGYRSWNESFDDTGLNELFGSDESKYDYLGPSTYGRKQFLDYLQNKGIFEIGGQQVEFKDGKWGIATPQSAETGGNPAGTEVVNTETGNGDQDGKKKTWYWWSNRWGVDFNPLRAIYAHNANRKITDFAKASEKPFLQDPFQFNTYVYSDLGAEIAGQQAEAQLNRYFSSPTTSSLDGYLAGKLDAAVKGLELKLDGLKQSNETSKNSQLLATQQQKENARSRHDITNQNALAMHQTQANKDKYELAFMNKDHEIWDNLLKGYQFKWDQLHQENKELQDAFAQKEISDEVATNLAQMAAANGYQLDADSVKLYQDVKNGVITASSLSEDDAKYQKFMQAANIAAKLENIEYGKYKGVRRIYSAKQGTKIRLANIKTKQKNADRFVKQLKDDMDRNDKSLDRLSKSVYRVKNRKK